MTIFKVLSKQRIDEIITHGNCPDGIGSALFLREVWPDAKITFARYGDEHLAKPRDRAVFCDFSPPREHAKAWVDAGAWVLDHHEKQQDVVALFGDRGFYSSEVSGTRLAFEVWLASDRVTTRAQRNGTLEGAWRHRRRAEDFADLVSIRDTWQKDHADWHMACATSAAVLLYGIERITNPWLSPDQLQAGYALQNKRLAEARTIADKLHAHSASANVLFVNGKTDLVSDTAETLRLRYPQAHRVLAAWRLLPGGQLYVTLRSLADHIDVGDIAKGFGGGGHKAAAGFTVEGADLGKAVKALNALQDSA